MHLQNPPRLIDFHSHYYDEGWLPLPTPQGSSSIARAWPLLTDMNAQLAAMDEAGIDAKVVSAPASTIVSPVEQLPMVLIERINDQIAELVARHPQRLLGLATIDAFQGQAAAREVVRAIKELQLSGICIDCSQGGHYLDTPQVRPVFEVASELGITVFIHPVSPSGLTERLARMGHTGTLLARGTEHAASMLTLLRSGILDRYTGLKVVLPMISVATLIFAGIAELEYKRDDGWKGSAPASARKNLYIDTMGFDLPTLRFALDILGAEHLLIGSDWPIMPITTRRHVDELLDNLDLSEEQKAAILSGNIERLLRPTAS